MRRKRPIPWWFWPAAILGLVLVAVGNFAWITMLDRIAH